MAPSGAEWEDTGPGLLKKTVWKHVYPKQKFHWTLLVSLQQFKLWIWIYEEGFFFEDSKQLVIIIYEFCLFPRLS